MAAKAVWRWWNPPAPNLRTGVLDEELDRETTELAIQNSQLSIAGDALIASIAGHMLASMLKSSRNNITLVLQCQPPG